MFPGNERFFRENYFGYLLHRSDKDPADGWYEGELWFFDNYIIPLARKLRECGVFGVSSDEYLNYALANRKEWEHKGKSIVASMKEKVEKEAQKLGLKRQGAAAEAAEEQSQSSEDSVVELVDVRAPPGKLGITIDTSSGCPVVHSLDADSPMSGRLAVGDVIRRIDDIEVASMSVPSIHAMLAVKRDSVRRFTVERPRPGGS